MAIREKCILVLLGNNTRVVKFASEGEVRNQVDVAVRAIRDTFNDVLWPGQEFFLKVKREEWGGVFVDLQENDEITDKSVVKAELKETMKDCDRRNELTAALPVPSKSGQSKQNSEEGVSLYSSVQLKLGEADGNLSLCQPNTKDCGTGTNLDKSIELGYIEEHSKIYGRKSGKITEYQERINEASRKICLANPNVMTNRGLLLEQARKKVNDSGYLYKKGKSRSKLLNTDDEALTPKRRKINQEYRLQRIAELQDKIKDLDERIEFKRKRRDAASNMRSYKECDELTEQMSNLKNEKRQLDTELSALTKKQKKSIWYKRRKDDVTDSSQSSDAKTPIKNSKSSLITRSSPFSTQKASVSSSSTQSDCFSSRSGSESDASAITDHDTVILSDEDVADVTKPSKQASQPPALKRANIIPPTASVSNVQYFQ